MLHHPDNIDLKFMFKGLGTYKYTVLHLIFRPSLPPTKTQNPQRSPATPAVLLNLVQQI
jgi:hypothetical protein